MYVDLKWCRRTKLTLPHCRCILLFKINAKEIHHYSDVDYFAIRILATTLVICMIYPSSRALPSSKGLNHIGLAFFTFSSVMQLATQPIFVVVPTFLLCAVGVPWFIWQDRKLEAEALKLPPNERDITVQPSDLESSR